MKFFRYILPTLLPMCLPGAAQSMQADKPYIVVVDQSGAPIYIAEGSVPALHWMGHADPAGRIELPPLRRNSDLMITAQGFRTRTLKSNGSEIMQHRVILEVGGGSHVEVTSSLEPLRPMRVSSSVIAALKIRGESPRYPEAAKAQQVNGAVIFHVVIGVDGKVLQVTLVSGPELLRKPYADALRNWEYRPYLLNGRPVEVETTVTLSLQMGE